MTPRTRWMPPVSILLITFIWTRLSLLPLLSWAASQRLVCTYLVYLIFKVTYWVIIYPKFTSPLRNIPQPPGGSFLLGHTIDLLKDPVGMSWRSWVDEIPHDGMFKIFTVLQSERLVVVSPAAIADVLVHRCYDFEKPQILRKTGVKILGDGVLFAEGDIHRQQRKILNPAFGFRHIKELYPMFWDRSSRLVKTLEEQGEHTDTESDKYITVEVGEWASKATLSIIEEAAMGIDTNTIEDPKEPLSLTYRTLMNPGKLSKLVQFSGLFLPAWLIRSIPTPLNRAIQRNASLIKDIIEAQKKLIKSPEQDTNLHPNSVITTLVKSEQFTTPELLEQMKTFLIAGHETTATALTWAIYLLTQHQDMQKRLREEINTSLSKDQPISATAIDNLPFLQAFTSEVLRIYPPVPATIRQAARPTRILSTPIPKGTYIMLLPWAINTNKAAWGPDAQTFNPDRWINSPTGGAESNYSTMTFLHGPRSCIGERFARGEFACLLAAWVGAFETEIEDPEREIKIDIASEITAKLKGGLRVRLRAVR